MERLASEGYPVFLTGDFNTPSHEDYTEATVGTREGIDRPIPRRSIGLLDVRLVPSTVPHPSPWYVIPRCRP